MDTLSQILPLTETVEPADQAAVAERVRQSAAAGTPVYPIGGGTSLDYGALPTRPGVGLAMTRLNRVIDYPAEDMTITVEAGLTVAELAERLAANRQRLPVDVPQPDRATVGGIVATGSAGPRRYAHGTIRDFVIGIRAVDGRGTAFSGGGRVVKNVAGYDLCRLMVGSLGTLGVITQVSLMVRPLPEKLAMVACDLPDFDAAERLLGGLVQTQTLPAAIELQAGRIRQDDLGLGPMAESSAARVFVGFEGSVEEVDWMVERLRQEWNELGASSPMVVSDGGASQLWDWLTAFPAEVQINVLPSATVEMIQHLLQCDPSYSIQAHAGNGVIRLRLPSLGLDQFTASLTEQLRPAVVQAGGTLTVLSCPEGVRLGRRDVWGPPGPGATVCRAIKDRFDPAGVLNPGRFAFED